MGELVVRSVDPKQDAAACAAVYAPFVQAGPTSFEEVAPDEDEMAGRIRKITATHPWLVAERDRVLAGYAYACSHRARPAYRWSTDVSVYVDARERRRGVGRRLYEELFERLRSQGFRIACAGITLPNEASVALHEKFGFVAVGVYRDIGWKAGGWRDVGWWQLDLKPETGEAPSEPLPPSTT
jgi:L-amino acid N-acyltransferase YncA